MRFVCDSCRAQYMISDEKVGPKGVKVRCKKCGFVILVKKTEAAAQVAPPPSMVDEGEDGMRTMVMPNPMQQKAIAAALAMAGEAPAPPPADPDTTFPGVTAETKTPQGALPPASEGDASKGAGDGGFFASVDEDEIGAVFDQVLNTSPKTFPKEGEVKKDAVGQDALGDDEDSRVSTRILDAGMMKKLTEEAAPAAAGDASKDKNGAAAHEWYVAIDEKQTGPMTVEKLKDHWDRGEVSPDSLCWRAGFADWIPLSEASELGPVLAPRPAKPVIVPPPQTVGNTSGPVMSVPVESAFSAGGVTKTVRSEVQVPLAAAPVEDTGSWKPSAASALASLVQEEMAVLAKPTKKSEPAGDIGGLLDIPATPSSEEKAIQSPRVNGSHASSAGSSAARPLAPPAPVPYVSSGASYSSPGMSSLRGGSSRNMMLMLIGGGILIVALLLVVVIVVLAKQPTPSANTPAPVVAAPVPAPVAAPAPTPAAVAPAVAPAPAAAAAPATAPAPNGGVAAAGTPVAAAPSAPKVIAPARQTGNSGANGNTRASAPTPSKSEPKVEAPSKPSAPVSGGDDDFARAFGGGGSRDVPKAAPAENKPKNVYVPPAPGSAGSLKESLEQGDVMEAVASNRSALAACAKQQKEKEPGLNGKIVLRVKVATSGRPQSVTVVTEEFKSTFMAKCASDVIKGLTFPKHKNDSPPIDVPLKF